MPTHHPPVRRGWRSALAAAVLATGIAGVAGPAPAGAATAGELFLSEYVEGSSNNKALEIANATGAPIDLSAGNYAVQVAFNGNPTPSLTIPLTGTVAAGDVFVLAHSSASAVILAQADQTNGTGWFNGDDAVLLRKGDAVIDSIGQLGVDPGSQWGSGLTSTADNSLRRKATVTGGDANPSDAFDPAAEWDGYATDAFDGLGAHPGPPPATTPPPAPPILEIGAVQGVVSDGADGATHASPFVDDTVDVRGVVTQKTLAKTARGSDKGFYLQDPDGDGDARTSDGIFVYLGRFGDVLRADGSKPNYVPEVGDEIVVRARVVEYFGLTELSSPRLVAEEREDVAIAPVVVDPPDDVAEAARSWERIEGMQAAVPAGSVAIDGRDVFPSTMDGEVWVVRGHHPLAQRDDPYARRVFRDPHPLDNVPTTTWDDGNGARILLGSLGLKATSGNVDELIAPIRTYDTITTAPAGGVHYSFGKYSLQPAEQLTYTRGVDPSRNAPPQAPLRDREYSVSTYNVENLYDFRDDPNDGCDFAGNVGCPGVRPPFDYVPASDAAYQERLVQIGRQIVQDLHAPDLLLIQEAEDQDVCRVVNGALVCDLGPGGDDADGRPDTLQELALAIAAGGGPAYYAAYDRDGADDRGIVSAFLYRTDRVEVLPASADDPVLGSSPDVEYRGEPLPYTTDVQNPKALNADLPDDVDRSTGTDGTDVFTRPPQVGHFRIWRGEIGGSVFTDLYAVSNHFSSGPDRRVGQRREQAAYNAAIATALHEAGEERVLIGGDLNVYPRPDDAFRPGHPQFGADQLGPLYEAGLHNLYDTLLAEVPASAYSYVFQGQTQTLDQIFVSEVLRDELVEFRAAHVNADFPADHEGDGTRGLSDHDPQVGRFVAGVAIDQLAALVEHLVGAGEIRDGKERQLLERLERARRAEEDGRTAAAQAQLEAFTNHVKAFTPRSIDDDAATALVAEAELFLQQR